MAFSAQKLKYDFSYNMHFFTDYNPIHMVRPSCKSGYVARKHQLNKSQFKKIRNSLRNVKKTKHTH